MNVTGGPPMCFRFIAFDTNCMRIPLVRNFNRIDIGFAHGDQWRCGGGGHTSQPHLNCAFDTQNNAIKLLSK